MEIKPNTLEEQIALLTAESEGKKIKTTRLDGRKVSDRLRGDWFFTVYRYDIVREPRIIWKNEFSNRFGDDYDTKDEAKSAAVTAIGQVKFKEAMPDE